MQPDVSVAWHMSLEDRAPVLVRRFQENLPSIDLRRKQAIIASLGGEVSVVNLAPPSRQPSAPGSEPLQLAAIACYAHVLARSL